MRSESSHQLSGVYPLGTTCAARNSNTMVYEFSYDSWGNQASQTLLGGMAVFTSDVLDRLVSWDVGVDGKEWYVSDASGESAQASNQFQ